MALASYLLPPRAIHPTGWGSATCPRASSRTNARSDQRTGERLCVNGQGPVLGSGGPELGWDQNITPFGSNIAPILSNSRSLWLTAAVGLRSHTSESAIAAQLPIRSEIVAVAARFESGCEVSPSRQGAIKGTSERSGMVCMEDVAYLVRTDVLE